MTKEELVLKLKEIVAKYVEEEHMPTEFDESLDLINDLGINSMHIIDIIIDVENEFDILISDEEIQQMTSLGKVIEILESKVLEKDS
ncbi:MAG: phosphopantetheine-binding protein [Bacteroidota bacterium]